MRFRAQLNELQMQLHDHPLNQAREARGELPVNSLWLWAEAQNGRIRDPHAGLCACWRSARARAFCGAPVHPLPLHLEKPCLKRNAWSCSTN